MTKVFITITTLLAILWTGQAHAGASDWVCDKMKDKAAYDASPDLKDFKYMVAGKDNWLFETSNDLKPDYSIHPSTLKFLEKITKNFKDLGIDLILVQMPTRGIMHADQFPDNINDYNDRGSYDAQRALDSYLHAAPTYNTQYQVNIVNIPDIKIGEPFYYATDLHWNAQGAKRMAQAVARYMDEHGIGKSLVKGEYETRFANKIPYKKAYPQLIEKICGNSVPGEEAEIYETAKTSSDVDTDTLFADLYPQVVLIGTSFSLQQNAAANFQGFLEENIKTDILNMSIAGGGDETAMLSYLRSGDYKKGKTKVAIWEIPGHYKLNLPTFVTSFEQIYANMAANCETPLATGAVTIGKRSQVLIDLVEKDLLPYGRDVALRLSYNEPISPRLTYIYRTQNKDGLVKRYKREIKWPDVAGKHPSFLTTLDVNDDERLVAVTYRGDASLEAVHVEGSLCRLADTGL